MKSRMVCDECKGEIPLEDVNVATDIALCRRCGQTWKYSDLVEAQTALPIDLNHPPRGAWYRSLPPRGFEVGASTRSAVAFFLVPFMCVWSGFSLGGIYGTQIAKGQFNLLQSLFGIPFLLGTLIFGSIALMSVCGKVVVRINGNEGVVFTGVGSIGWRRKFSWKGVTAIRRSESYSGRGQTTEQITLDGEKRLNFATGMSSDRFDFLLAALQRMQRERR